MAINGGSLNCRALVRADVAFAGGGAEPYGKRFLAGLRTRADAWVRQRAHLDRRILRFSVRLLPEVLAGYLAEAERILHRKRNGAFHLPPLRGSRKSL